MVVEVRHERQVRRRQLGELEVWQWADKENPPSEATSLVDLNMDSAMKN